MTEQVAFITGGGTGIGRAVAEAFVARGDQVVLVGRREEPLQRAVKELGEKHAAWTTCDVAAPFESERAIEFALERFGRLDVLVNNAAQFMLKPLAETSDAELRDLFAANVLGPLALIRAATPHLATSKGCVINVSSVVAQAVVGDSVAYSASKAALEQLTRALAVELGPQQIRVNAVAPGLTVTEMSERLREDAEYQKQTEANTPLGRLGRPDDMAGPILFLASPESGWITGQVIQATGGLML